MLVIFEKTKDLLSPTTLNVILLHRFQLYDGSSSIGQYRGHKNNLVITSKTGTLRVNLRSDDSINGLGFSASYKEEGKKKNILN